ncbi:alpha/beta hydrolase [Actinomadura atramentaria]|uniref:alpha/beta hydrolase n=1 Tax=Actinomadura atramentaria TaxID=1990 RepID=UPI00035C3493|nr:alpha/beta hydrolase [Actinomadura atramentaria]
MPYVLLVVGAALALVAANARWPRSAGFLLVPSFFSGWLATELAPHLLVLEAVALAALAVSGGLAGWAGWCGLALGIVATAGTVATIVLSRRTVVTLRDCGIPRELHHGASRYPRSHLAVPPLCFVPRRGVRVDRNVVYWEEKRLRLDVYRPAADGELRPGLLQIHGGAWVVGDKREQGLPLLNHMAVHGWVGFNVNYRLSPRATWPDHIVDLKRFIAWYREHAAEYGADPDFLCVTGGSAGGHLAALVALTAGDPEYQPGFEDADTSVRAAVPFYGIYNLVDPGPWRVPMGATGLMRKLVFKRSLRADPEPFRRASPEMRVHADAPPFFVIHGTHDSLVPVAEARRFVTALRAASANPVAYAEMRGGQHAFDVFPSYRSARVIEAVERYLTGVHREERTQDPS